MAQKATFSFVFPCFAEVKRVYSIRQVNVVDFAVIPEPSTLLLLSLGAVILRKKEKISNKENKLKEVICTIFEAK